jgi:hypothetical protein
MRVQDSLEEVIFSYPIKPVVGEGSPPWFNRMANGTITNIIASTMSTTSGSSEFSISLNGGVFGYITLASGTRQTAEVEVQIDIEYGDLLSVAPITVNADLLGVTIQLLLGE